MFRQLIALGVAVVAAGLMDADFHSPTLRFERLLMVSPDGLYDPFVFLFTCCLRANVARCTEFERFRPGFIWLFSL